MKVRAVVAALALTGMFVVSLQMSHAWAQVPKSTVRPVAGGYLVPVAVGAIAGALLWPVVVPLAETAFGIGATAAAPAAAGVAAPAAPAAEAAAGSWWPSFITGRTVLGAVIGGTLAYVGVR